MRNRLLGATRKNLPAIGLGCMGLSEFYGPPTEQGAAIKLLHQAIELGVVHFDTAELYGMGANETLLRDAFHDRRDKVFIATKFGPIRDPDTGIPTGIDGSRENCRRAVEGSLNRLQTDVIDLYYLHRVDANVPVEESIGALSRMVEQGKVRTIGASEIGDENLRKAHATHPLIAVQSEYSLWTRTPERKVLATCQELGISFVAFAPLARQFLTGQCTDLSHFDENDIRCSNARPRFEPENFAQNEKLLTPYSEIADRVDCSMAQLALAWLLARGDNIIPIPGTKHVDYMIENAGAGDIRLDPETVQELDQLINEDTVSGDRYQSALMKSIDSEKD